MTDSTRGDKMLARLLKFQWLQGHRTQAVAVIMAGLTLALNLGWIDQKAYTTIVSFLTSVGLITASVHKPTS